METETLKKAIAKYGTIPQMDMVVEECAELIQAINKMKRVASKDGVYPTVYPTSSHSEQYCNTYFNLCDEIADVKIMVAQMELILSKRTIAIAVKTKMERLKTNLNK
jgi:NTP pyrophosphatase (non-canonical NTP hydrolase)